MRPARSSLGRTHCWCRSWPETPDPLREGLGRAGALVGTALAALGAVCDEAAGKRCLEDAHVALAASALRTAAGFLARMSLADAGTTWSPPAPAAPPARQAVHRARLLV